jgi:holdfast attachment protein HfaA
MFNAKASLGRAALASAVLLVSTGTAFADDYSNAANYNHGYGMSAGEESQNANPSLRDANGNLTVVNGQFTSSNFNSQSAMAMSSSGSSLANLGTQGSGAGFNGATAIGNQLNVVTVGNFNTVVVSSHQSNSGTVTATVSTNGSK